MLAGSMFSPVLSEPIDLALPQLCPQTLPLKRCVLGVVVEVPGDVNSEVVGIDGEASVIEESVNVSAK